MAKSQIRALCDFLSGTYRFEQNARSELGIYHAARVARDALRKRDGGERFLAVRRALSPLAVMVSREADGRIRLHRPDTNADFYMGKAE